MVVVHASIEDVNRACAPNILKPAVHAGFFHYKFYAF